MLFKKKKSNFKYKYKQYNLYNTICVKAVLKITE